MVRLGSSYGGWYVPVELLSPESIVYSGGVGEDASFDLALIETVGCSVWAFDPTPRSVAFASRITDPSFHFLPYALWSTDTTLPFFPPRDARHVSHSLVDLQGTGVASVEVECRTIATVMSELGHDRIDLLKLDIEGAEYQVLASLGDVQPLVICVELHPAVGIRGIVSFVRSLPYDVARIDRWNVTLVARDVGVPSGRV